MIQKDHFNRNKKTKHSKTSNFYAKVNKEVENLNYEMF